MKFLVLEVLAQAPCHGYDVIMKVEERYGFRPSAGSIYPTLQMLEDGGYVTSAQTEGKRIYTITESGRQLLEKRPASEETDELDNPHDRLKTAAKRLMVAVWGTLAASDSVLDGVTQALERARKEVYTIMSSDAEKPSRSAD